MHIIRSDSAVAHCKTPLVVRASLLRTFWSLGVFVELGLIFCGVYLLAEASLKAGITHTEEEAMQFGIDFAEGRIRVKS